MTTLAPPTGVGALLREWRRRRRMSQLDLAVSAEVSARHLSFIETGRAKPSRELVMHLAEHLDVPLRERNALFLAAGYAPAYRQTPLDAPDMAPVRQALDKIVRGHEPFPAVVVDRHWNLVMANAPALAIVAEGAAPHLLAETPNALRVTLHPDGMAPRIANFSEWAAHLLERLHRQIAVSGDTELRALAEELRSYPGVADAADVAASGPSDAAARLFVPLVVRQTVRDRAQELRLFSTIATFGTALDVTVGELAIEAFFPADEPTAAALRELASGRSDVPDAPRQAT